MLKNNLKLAWRNLKRYQLYSIINILGLSFGMACFIFVALYAIDELTFDKFHAKADQIYRLVQHRDNKDQGSQSFGAVSFSAGLAAREELPGVVESARLFLWGRAVLRNTDNEQAFYQPYLTAENSIFQIFDFDFIAGQPNTALNRPNTVVLTESLAEKLFPLQDGMGKTLQSDRGMVLEVSGIIRDIPTNSHLQFESLVSHKTIEAQPWWNERRSTDWVSQQWGTYLLLEDEISPQEIGNKLTAFARQRAKEDQPFEGTLALQSLGDIHFESEGFQRELNAGKSSYRYLYIFLLIGVFVMGIACINYINLATARATNYAREVGVRKAIGAQKGQLFHRFMSESAMLTVISFVIALGIVHFLLPLFNNFTNKSLSLHPGMSGWTLPILAFVVVLVSLAAGGYPSLYLSRFRPAQVLKGHANANQQGGYLRQALVVVQFAISILMIIGTLLVWQQMRFVSSRDLGFDKDHLIVVDINSGRVRNGFETIKQGYSQLPSVSSTSVSSRVPGEWKNLIQAKIHKSEDISLTPITPWYLGIDEDFLGTFDIDLVAGRNFDLEYGADSTAVIINRTAADILGISEVSEQSLTLVSRINNGAEFPLAEAQRVRVIGIVEDFNFQSLYEPVDPLILAHHSSAIQSIDYFSARISAQNIDKTIAQMTDILQAVDPDHLFEYHFLDDQIAKLYEADAQRGTLFSFAALCAIFIACLGLFGLATFTAERRAKEIGIRKVLGASVPAIVRMLSNEFLRLVLIALLIASPIAFIIMNRWLGNFAFRIDIQWWVFALAGLLSLIIALLTVSYQSIQAALANPIKSLRDE